MDAVENHIQTLRTGRYFTAGPADAPRIWFVLHGYGQLASYFIKNFAPLVARGDRVVAIEGLSRFYLDGTFGRVGATWMTKEDRLHEIEDYIRYLDGVFDREMANLPAAQREVVLLGFSQGTATAVRWVKSGRIQPDAMVIWAGDIPREAGQALAIKMAQKPVWMAVGDQDEYISEELAAKRAAELKELLPQLQLLQFEGTHKIPRKALETLLSRMYPGQRA